jgi:hypothetical protein
MSGQTCSNCTFWAYLDNNRGECTVTDAPEPVVRVVVRVATESNRLRAHTPVSEADRGNYSADLLTPADHYCACWQPREEESHDR